MGHGPNLKAKIAESTENEAELEKAIKIAEDNLGNSYQKGIDFINKYTEGILTDENDKLVGVLTENQNSYTKFSESYSLDALTPIIDGAVSFAVDYLEGGEEGVNAAKLAGDTGKIVKGIMSLFASSSTTDKKINQIFTQFRSGEDNYAIYYASNSGTVKADNAWGKKELIVITNIYIFAQVNENKAITKAEERQHILDNIKKATEILSDKTVEAITNPDLDKVIGNAQTAIDKLNEQYNNAGGE